MQVVLVVDAAVELSQPHDLAWHTGCDRLIAAFRQAIEADLAGASTLGSSSATSASTDQPVGVPLIHVVSTAQLQSDAWRELHQARETDGSQLVIPLTLDVPKTLAFAGQAVYQQCREVMGLRQLVQSQLGYAVGEGRYWLPIVQTAKGPLYGEVIGLDDTSTSQGKTATDSYLSYYQPLHLPDQQRQPLYRLGRSLPQLLAVPPATYLLQFGFQQSQICFDRLWPFPATPAIASVGVQDPDLLTCHWRCLTGRPIRDLQIAAIAKYQVYQGAT
jgi:hypothetical protein